VVELSNQNRRKRKKKDLLQREIIAGDWRLKVQVFQRKERTDWRSSFFTKKKGGKVTSSCKSKGTIPMQREAGVKGGPNWGEKEISAF